MLALTIVVALQSVGIVLVAALLVTPAAAAYQLTSRFSPMMALAAVFGAVSTVGGLYLSVLSASLKRRDDRAACHGVVLCRRRSEVRSPGDCKMA